SQVVKDRVVYFRYIMKNSRNEIVEDTMNGTSTAYLHGASSLDPHLQEQFEGLHPGAVKKLFLPGTSGPVTQQFTFDVIIDNVREASADELRAGYPIEKGDVTCGTDCGCYSAGRNG
ncbi:MAG: hypothetical protein WKF70_13625, partial [Chitinophagaceae bacterium]